MSTKERALQDIGRGCAECLAEMVAALECDYDLLQFNRHRNRLA